jgi:hypothetical protein
MKMMWSPSRSGCVEAFEHRDRAGDHRRTAPAFAQRDAFEAVVAACGKAVGERALICRQDVDRVVRTGGERRQRRGPPR